MLFYKTPLYNSGQFYMNMVNFEDVFFMCIRIFGFYRLEFQLSAIMPEYIISFTINM